jgi:RNA polymerase sigma factor (sigma-70 family)
LLFLVVRLDVRRNTARDGTTDAFTELYEEFLPKVLAFISYRVADTHLAEDLTSAVFEKAMIKFNTYDTKKGKFATWLFSIARNTLTDHFRASNRYQTVTLDSIVSVCDDKAPPDDAAVMDEERRRLYTCIGRLTGQEQEIISLKFGAEMTNRQISRLLGLTESNVGVIVYRTVRKLRDDFGKREDE